LPALSGPATRPIPGSAQYHIQHCTVLLVFFGLDSTELLAPPLFMLLSVLGLSVCLATMIWFSDAAVRPAKPDTDEQRLPLPTEQ
jgi:hypothetical protein